MPVTLLLPGRRIPAPKPPSRIALDMAFGVGAGAVLGDKSRYRSHGAITTATWAAGVHGSCLNFVPGNPDYVEIPAAHTQLDFTSEDFSLIARIYVDDLSINRVIFNRGLAAADGWRFSLEGGSYVIMLTHQFGSDQLTRSAVGSILINTWYTVGFSRQGADVFPYINGALARVGAPVHVDPDPCARSAKIGIYDDLVSTPFDGRIEFLRIFRGIALAVSEHLAWHNALA